VPKSLQCKISLPSLNSPSTSSAQLKDPAILSSIKVNSDSHPERMVSHSSTVSPDFTAGKTPAEPTGNAAFPPIGSRVLAMTNKTGLTTNAPLSLQNGVCFSSIYSALLIYLLLRWTSIKCPGTTPNFW
jgi:hypothetical protein